MFDERQTPIEAPAPGAPGVGTREIYTMPEQFVARVIPKDWKGITLLVSLAVLLGGLIVGASIFLMRSLREEAPLSVEEELPPVAPSVAPEVPAEVPEPPEVPEVPLPTPPPVPEVPAPSPPLSPTAIPSTGDSDSDGMTDIEEELIGTNPTEPDTDGDGFKDSDELINLFNPRLGQGARLQSSGLILVFTNPVFKWTIFYLPAWLARPLDETAREVIITAATGEFIQISEQLNSEKLSVTDWYLSQAPGIDRGTLSEMTTKSGLTGLRSPDGLTFYLQRPGSDIIYLISYNIGTRTELNFPAIFKMMVESFTLP